MHGTGIGIGVCNEYVATNSNLTDISIYRGDLREGVAEALVSAMKTCTNLNEISMYCKVDDVSLKVFATGIRGLSSVQRLSISMISIDGTEGAARAIVALFQDPKCNIADLKLCSAGLNNESIQIIVNGLRGNAKLHKLDLSRNNIERSTCESIVSLLQDPRCNLASLSFDMRFTLT